MPPCKSVVAVRPGRSPLSRHHPYKHHRLSACTRAGAGRLDAPPAPEGPGRDPPGPGQILSTPALVGDKYLLLHQVEGSALYRCINIHTRQEYVAKVLTPEAGRVMATAHLRMWGHPHVSPLSEVVVGAGGGHVCLLLPPAPGGDLHSHVRARRRLRESEARRLFRQMAAAVRDCHHRALVLRDLKLRKFVFADKHRTHLRLESLEDAVVVGHGEPPPHSDDFANYSPAFPSSYAVAVAPQRCHRGRRRKLEDVDEEDVEGEEEGEFEEEEEDDELEEKRGCPAYVAPEILRSGEKYSGRAADMWSLGVALYTMLVGRYPFNDSQHASLFAKISRGRFGLPETMSPRARCLVRALLRREPGQRLSAADVLLHPWLAPAVDGRARHEDEDEGEEEEDGGPEAGGAKGPGRRPSFTPGRARERAGGDQAVPEWGGGDGP